MNRSSSPALAWALGSALLSAACAESGAESGKDAATDASNDASIDASDAAVDATDAASSELLLRQFAVARLIATPSGVVARTAFLDWPPNPQGPGETGLTLLPLDGSGVVPLASTELEPGWGVAVAGGWVYGADPFDQNFDAVAAQLWRVPIAGGARETLVAGMGGWDVASNDSYVVFSEHDSGSIARVPVAGGGPEVVVTGLNAPSMLAVDATHVYWSEFDALRRAPLSGGSPETIAAGESPAERIHIELGGSEIFWLNTTGQVRAIPKSGGIAEDVALLSGCADFAVDDMHVYCTTQAAVVRVSRSGNAALQIVVHSLDRDPTDSHPQHAGRIALTETHVFFTVGGVEGQQRYADEIRRIPKP